MNNQITILLSHPNISNSMFNKHLVDINRKNPNFVFHHLDKNRVNGYFDLEAEKKLLRESKAIVWQFPIYWYNSPASLRDGAAAEHYTHEGLNRYTAEEMLIPFEMTANAAGMKWFKPLGFYGCSPDMTKAALDKAAKEYEESLLELL